jgi:hypothetical protein
MDGTKWVLDVTCPMVEGQVDTSKLKEVPDKPGVYFIGSKHGTRYVPYYIGRSKRMRSRLKNHLHQNKNGSKQISELIHHHRQFPNIPFNGFYIGYLETSDHKIIEAEQIDLKDPSLNIQGIKYLPPGITDEMLIKSERDGDMDSGLGSFMKSLWG